MSNSGGDLDNTMGIVGADGTPIGNVLDRFKVDAQVTITQEGIVTQLNANRVFSVAVLVSATSSGVDNPLLLVTNPTGSGKVLYFLRAVGNTTISNERTLFGVHRAPTVTANGTAETPQSRNVGGGSPASAVLAYTLPTITASGTVLSWAQAGENTNDQEFVSMEQLALRAGQTLLITGRPKTNSRTQQITIVWAEVTA